MKRTKIPSFFVGRKKRDGEGAKHSRLFVRTGNNSSLLQRNKQEDSRSTPNYKLTVKSSNGQWIGAAIEAGEKNIIKKQNLNKNVWTREMNREYG